MRVKLQLTATLISVAAILAGVVCKKWLPEYWNDILLVTIVLMWVIEMAMSFVVEKISKDLRQPTLEGKKSMRTYMIAKTVKGLICIVYIVGGLIIMNGEDSKQATAFAISAVVLYMLHLGAETFVVTKK